MGNEQPQIILVLPDDAPVKEIAYRYRELKNSGVPNVEIAEVLQREFKLTEMEKLADKISCIEDIVRQFPPYVLELNEAVMCCELVELPKQTRPSGVYIKTIELNNRKRGKYLKMLRSHRRG